MDDERDKQKTVEVMDTSDQPAEGGKMVEESATEHAARMNAREDELDSLFDKNATEKFHARWLVIQSKFVDDPKVSVKEADDLVEDVIQNITQSFADRRSSMEKGWNSGGQISTEDLRIALKQYRSFFERLLSLES
jgi:hypothetical protein